MAQFLMAMPPAPDDADNPLRRIQTGPLFPEVDEFERRFGLEVFTGYGMTEIGCSMFGDRAIRTDWRSRGRACEGYDLRVVDEHDEEVPDGEVGELLVRSHRPWELNVGYYRNPEATARAWRNGWFHTGDGFRRDPEGNYFFVDRLKDAMRKKGENVSSLEVEGYVREHPGVLEVAAVAAPSDFGAGEDEVKVVVVARPDSHLDPRALLEFLEPEDAEVHVPAVRGDRGRIAEDGNPACAQDRTARPSGQPADVGSRATCTAHDPEIPEVVVKDYETILVEVDRGAATLTLNRPEKMNAINFRMDFEFREAMWGSTGTKTSVPSS